jgi:hypothetical protein
MLFNLDSQNDPEQIDCIPEARAIAVVEFKPCHACTLYLYIYLDVRYMYLKAWIGWPGRVTQTNNQLILI